MDAFCLYKTSIISIFSVTFRSVDSFFIINEYFHSFKKIYVLFSVHSLFFLIIWRITEMLLKFWHKKTTSQT